MKKILISILTILGIGVSFCSADNVSVSCDFYGCSPDIINIGNCDTLTVSDISSSDDEFFVSVSYCASGGNPCSVPFNIFTSSDRSVSCLDYDGNNYQGGTISFSSSSNISFVVGGVVGDNSSGGLGSGGNENTGNEVILTSNSYINILNNSFGLFQYYFFNLVQILPYILLIMGLIGLFFYIFSKSR